MLQVIALALVSVGVTVITVSPTEAPVTVILEPLIEVVTIPEGAVATANVLSEALAGVTEIVISADEPEVMVADFGVATIFLT